MKKVNIIILTLIIILSFCACGNSSKEEKEKANTNNDYLETVNTAANNRNPALYGTSLNNSYTDNKEVIYSKDGEIEIKVGISNEYTKAEYGFIVFVDGIRVPFALNENEEEKMLHIIEMDSEERDRVLTVKLSDEYLPANSDANVSIATILNPNFMIKSTEYISFLPHHALAAYNFYTVRKESGETPAVSVADKVSAVYELPEKINSMYMQKEGSPDDPFGKGENVEYSNSLDDTTEFLFSSTDNFENMESCFACEKGKDFNIKIACIGKSGLFRLSLYINNELVSGFNGCDYFDIETERDELKVIDVSLDKDILANLDEYNCIYLIAVPLDPSMEESDYVRPLKTTSKMLFLSDDVEKVNEILQNYGSLKNTENTATSSESSTDAETTKKPVTTTEKVVTTTENPVTTTEKAVTTTENPVTTTEKAVTTTEKTVETTHKKTDQSKNNNSSYSTDAIRDVWSFENGAVLVQCKDWTIHVYDPKNKVIEYNGIPGGPEVKKLDNGIALVDSFDFNFRIYDCELNLIKEGKLPYYEGDEVAFTISSDGKKLIYCVNEGAKGNYIYTNNVSLNSKKLVCKLPDYSEKGKLVWIDEFSSFDGEKALFYGSYTQKVSSGGQIELGNCYGIISTNGTVNKQNDDSQFKSWQAKGKNLVVADSAEMDGKVELWSLTKGSKKISLKTVDESYGASVSENCKYLATQSCSSDNSKITVKIYDYSTMTLLYSQSFKSAGRLDIDFVESESCAYIANKNTIIKVNLDKR